jgi:hypothetical protein
VHRVRLLREQLPLSRHHTHTKVCGAWYGVVSGSDACVWAWVGSLLPVRPTCSCDACVQCISVSVISQHRLLGVPVAPCRPDTPHHRLHPSLSQLTRAAIFPPPPSPPTHLPPPTHTHRQRIASYKEIKRLRGLASRTPAEEARLKTFETRWGRVLAGWLAGGPRGSHAVCGLPACWLAGLLAGLLAGGPRGSCDGLLMCCEWKCMCFLVCVLVLRTGDTALPLHTDTATAKKALSVMLRCDYIWAHPWGAVILSGISAYLHSQVHTLNHVSDCLNPVCVLVLPPHSYEYDGEATCAADGMCQEKCPVKINTGELQQKHLKHSTAWHSTRDIDVHIATQHSTGLTSGSTSLPMLRPHGSSAAVDQ